MEEYEKWMLITYYCPIHGDSSIVSSTEITKKEISEIFLKKARLLKIKYLKNLFIK